MDNGYSVQANTTEALGITEEVRSVVEKVKTDMEDLYKIICDLTEHSIVFNWSADLKAQWDSIYKDKVEGVIKEMSDLANKTESVTEDVIKYSEQG